MMFCPQFNREHRKLLQKLSPSSELQRDAEEAVNNEIRLSEHQKRMDMYRDKQVSEEYEQFLDNIGHP